MDECGVLGTVQPWGKGIARQSIGRVQGGRLGNGLGGGQGEPVAGMKHVRRGGHSTIKSQLHAWAC